MRKPSTVLPLTFTRVKLWVWWPGQCFMRTEDMILITEDGSECLTNFDRFLRAARNKLRKIR